MKTDQYDPNQFHQHLPLERQKKTWPWFQTVVVFRVTSLRPKMFAVACNVVANPLFDVLDPIRRTRQIPKHCVPIAIVFANPVIPVVSGGTSRYRARMPEFGFSPVPGVTRHAAKETTQITARIMAGPTPTKTNVAANNVSAQAKIVRTAAKSDWPTGPGTDRALSVLHYAW